MNYEMNYLEYIIELVHFSGNPGDPPRWYNSGVKESLARNSGVCLVGIGLININNR